MRRLSHIFALSAAVLSIAPANAQSDAAFECALPYVQTSQAIAALDPLDTAPPIQGYAPGDARAFGWPVAAIWAAGDSESHVFVVRIAAPMSSVLPEVLRRRGLDACPRLYAVDYCYFGGGGTKAELVVQSDPETPGASVLVCSFAAPASDRWR